jgi:polyhydroxybutyrate depolymerase
MHFHGMDDKIVPYEGPRGGRTPKTMQFKGVDETIRVWRDVNGCAGEPSVTKVEDKAGDGMAGTIKTYGGGKQGAEVVLVTIEKAGHTWPGREPIVGFIGKSGKNVIANDLMWEFFQKHPMQ